MKRQKSLEDSITYQLFLDHGEPSNVLLLTLVSLKKDSAPVSACQRTKINLDELGIKLGLIRVNLQ